MSNFKIIENNRKAKYEFGYCYGAEEYEISKEDIHALLTNKVLASTVNGDDYTIFVSLENSDNQENKEICQDDMIKAQKEACLIISCNNMVKALMSYDKQSITESMANLYKGIKDYMDTGVISYEAVDSEIIRLFGENY